MKRYICSNCGYVYDSSEGDPMDSVPPGSAFEDLPPDWCCPLCYAAKSAFDEME